jgi:L-2-hydroxycarboxylate dehydrogenase (NAD+)
MNLQSAKAARIPTTAVTGLIVDALGKVGVPVDDASKIAALMLEADLVGADAHGVFRLPQYSRRLRLGSTNPRPKITVLPARSRRWFWTLPPRSSPTARCLTR